MSVEQQRPAMLEGVRVIDLTRNLPGPFATRMLADMGADVLKVEPPQGDEARGLPPLFTAVNVNKQGVRLDIKKPDDKARLIELVPEADVLVESFRPGALKEQGLGYEALSALNPKLVMCSITGYGQDGPWAHRAGHDMNFMAISGALDLNKTPTGDIPLPSIQFGDLLGGSAMAVIGILSAVVDARARGKGRHVDVSMADGVLAHAVTPLATSQLWRSMLGRWPGPGEDMLNGGLPCYNLYKTADQRYLAVGALEHKFWRAACEGFNRPEWMATHWQMGVLPNTPASKQLIEEVAALVASQPLAHWAAVFEKIDACITPVLTLEEALEHPVFVQRSMVTNHANQSIFSLPIQFSDHSFLVRQPIPN